MTTRLSEQDQRIACAEELGWKEIRGIWGVYGEANARTGELKKVIPDFLYDANAALLLVQHLAKQGWAFQCVMTPNGRWVCEFAQGKRHPGTGDTLAQAICESFLRATNRWKK